MFSFYFHCCNAFKIEDGKPFQNNKILIFSRSLAITSAHSNLLISLENHLVIKAYMHIKYLIILICIYQTSGFNKLLKKRMISFHHLLILAFILFQVKGKNIIYVQFELENTWLHKDVSTPNHNTYQLCMQCLRVVYHGISQMSLAFSSYTHSF